MAKKEEKVSRFQFRFDGSPNAPYIEGEVEKFYLGRGMQLENKEQGYAFACFETPTCMECSSEIVRVCVAMGVVYLGCHCSDWKASARPLSGSPVLDSDFVRTRRWTEEERRENAIRSYEEGMRRVG